MTIKLLQSTAAALRRAGSFAGRARRARLERRHVPFIRSDGAPSGRYFGLLVHVDRSDR
jgi:hypothetical protein